MLVHFGGSCKIQAFCHEWDRSLQLIGPSIGNFFIWLFPEGEHQGPIPDTIRSRSAQIQSCDPDRPVAFHKRRSRSAHQIEKLRNQAVYRQLNHDINHSMLNLELIITRSRLNEKCQTDDIYSWRHNGRCGDVIFVCWYRERHGQFSARTQVLFMIERGLNMPCLTGMCMWLTSLKIYCWHKTDHVPVNVSR